MVFRGHIRHLILPMTCFFFASDIAHAQGTSSWEEGDGGGGMEDEEGGRKERGRREAGREGGREGGRERGRREGTFSPWLPRISRTRWKRPQGGHVRRLPPQQHSQELGPCARLSVVTVSAN